MSAYPSAVLSCLSKQYGGLISANNEDVFIS